MSQNVLISPSRYVQGRIIDQIGTLLKPYGDKVLFICSPSAFKITKDRISESCEKSQISCVFESFNRECCRKEVDRLKELTVNSKAQIVCSVGGGKTLDSGKLVAAELNLVNVVFPTICATDAPCSALSVLYTEQGEFEKYVFFKKNPDMVLVDVEIVSKAPARLLVSGMGDALSTWFEAEAAAKTHKGNCAGGCSTMTALALAKLCYQTLLSDGYQALLACKRQAVTPSFEKICEANTLLSGIGFESSGLCAAHAIHNGLTSLEETHAFYHGEKVAIGTLCQLILQNEPKAVLDEVFHFCLSVGLPVELADIGILDPTHEQLLKVAEKATIPGETIHNMPFPITAEMVCSALLAVDEMGQMYKKNYKGWC